ncbi:hypothetical protein COCCADRAFT_86692, partial [Bipolaris zeicola 26-R-13]
TPGASLVREGLPSLYRSNNRSSITKSGLLIFFFLLLLVVFMFLLQIAFSKGEVRTIERSV